MDFMAEIIDPEIYGLPKRTLLEKEGRTLYLVIDRKSRVIMADGRKIMLKVEQIRSADPKIKIGLKINAPLCSKTKAFLEEAGLKVIL